MKASLQVQVYLVKCSTKRMHFSLKFCNTLKCMEVHIMKCMEDVGSGREKDILTFFLFFMDSINNFEWVYGTKCKRPNNTDMSQEAALF